MKFEPFDWALKPNETDCYYATNSGCLDLQIDQWGDEEACQLYLDIEVASAEQGKALAEKLRETIEEFYAGNRSQSSGGGDS